MSLWREEDARRQLLQMVQVTLCVPVSCATFFVDQRDEESRHAVRGEEQR